MNTPRAKHFATWLASTQPAVVGTVHNAEGLNEACRLRKDVPDLIELRVDQFAGSESRLLATARKLRVPLIITVRSPEEGGGGGLPAPARAEWLHRFLEVAAAIDVELGSLPSLRAVTREASRRGIGVVLSFHDFDGTPSLTRLRTLARRAAAQGADVFKCATRLRSPSDLLTLHRLLHTRPLPVPIAAMGMGPGAAAARLVLAGAGSALTYGFIGRPNAPGQLPATLVKPLLELLAHGDGPEAPAR